MLWLTPPMDRLFVEGPGGRRRLLDRLVLGLDPAHAARVARYEQALRERSRLLRDARRGRRPGSPRLEEIMAAEGVAVAAARRDAIERLDRVCAAADGAFPRARLSLDRHGRGAGSTRCRRSPPRSASGRRWRASRASDALAGGAGLGPHRSDLAVVHAEKAHRRRGGLDRRAEGAVDRDRARPGATCSARCAASRRSCCSTRSPRISMPSRRAALFEVLAGLEGQAWITGTDAGAVCPAARRRPLPDGVRRRPVRNRMTPVTDRERNPSMTNPPRIRTSSATPVVPACRSPDRGDRAPLRRDLDQGAARPRSGAQAAGHVYRRHR